MRKAFTVFVILLCPVALKAANQGKPVESLARTGKWNLDYDHGACSIWGKFGEGNAEVLLRMTRYDPESDWVELAVYGSRFESNSPFTFAKTDFNSNGSAITSQAINGKADDRAFVLIGNRNLLDQPIRSTKDYIALTHEQQDAVTDITIKIGYSSSFRLPLGPGGKVWAALRTCTADLVRIWGFDPEVQATLSQPPKPLGNWWYWLQSFDYPEEALVQGRFGIVHFWLDIEADGRVSGCHVQRENKSSEFEKITCAKILQRARFAPATDKNGNPVRSYFASGVNWSLPVN